MTTVRHQLSLNENFAAPLPGVHEAIVDGAHRVNLTLDAMSSGLTQAIAGHHGVDPARVFVGPGSGALLQQFLNALAAGGEVVHAWPSFEMYPLMVRSAGAEAVPVPLRDDAHDLAAMADAVTDRTKVVLVCNPNNPTGTVFGDAELRALLDRLPEHVLVLIDEAYVDFADRSETADGLRFAAEDSRVCVVRTFSKSHGLLGLRVGYLIAGEAVVTALRPGSYFFRVSTVAQDAALAALRAEVVMRKQCAEVAAERDRVGEQLRALGLAVPRSHGNFHWLPLGADNDAFVRFCAAGGVEVRTLGDGAGVRVTVGTPEANEALLDLTRRFVGGERLSTERA
ncbi:histidinol-phosphate aminotransferase [Saccharopolyspora kobensis]|uniref:Histidinol-phosphate aminotransferase n=1 Tax=Saccharopolyspora kobensis TaxID=146035 RepID=A0A1H6AAX3_9PSEU|nr:histidinol-phosphate aminotransferase [Saccharopolyspora kobensis]SFE53707.1 histidinol-phosphate aminotransferase [Saccharopolyspora kobensis]